MLSGRGHEEKHGHTSTRRRDMYIHLIDMEKK